VPLVAGYQRFANFRRLDSQGFKGMNRGSGSPIESTAFEISREFNGAVLALQGGGQQYKLGVSKFLR
jgi:hypothetical protein